MATITVVVGEPPYGKERIYTTLRFALAARCLMVFFRAIFQVSLPDVYRDPLITLLEP